MGDAIQEASTAHLQSFTESSKFSPTTPTTPTRSRFTSMVKDAIHYLKVPFPEKDKVGRPRANSANSLASWATFRRQNGPDITASHSSAELSIFCAGENVTPASSEACIADTSPSANTLDSVHAALNALNFPTPQPQLSSTPARLNDRPPLPQRQPDVTRSDRSPRRPVDAPSNEHLSQSSAATGPRVHLNEIRAVGESATKGSDFTRSLPRSISLGSQSSKSAYSQETARDECPPTVLTLPPKETAHGPFSNIYATPSPLNSLGLYMNNRQSAALKSSGPRNSPIITTSLAIGNGVEVNPTLGDDENQSDDDQPLLLLFNNSRAKLSPRDGDTRGRSDATVTLNSNPHRQQSPRFENSDSMQLPMPSSTHVYPQNSASPHAFHPQPGTRPFQGCLFLLNESELSNDLIDVCDCDSCKARSVTCERETPGHRFTRIINERHAMRPKTIVEESGSLRSASASSGNHSATSGSSGYRTGTSGSSVSLLPPSPSSSNIGHVTISSVPVRLSGSNRKDEPARQLTHQCPPHALSFSKALPPLPVATALNPDRRPSAEDLRRDRVVNQAVVNMVFGDEASMSAVSDPPPVQPLALPYAMSAPGFGSPARDVSPSASSYFARAPRSALSLPLSNLFDLPLEPINYPPLSPKRRNNQSLQRKSTILGLLKKTQSAMSLRSTTDAAAPEGPAMATLAPVEVKRALSMRVDKEFPTSRREKKAPPPIVIVPYQEHQNVLPTKTSTFEVYDDPFARIVSPPQSPGDVQATSPLEHDGSKINLNFPYSPAPSSWTAVSYASSPTLVNHSPVIPESVSSMPYDPPVSYEPPDGASADKRSSHRRSSSEINTSKSFQRFLPKRFGFVRPFHNAKGSKSTKKIVVPYATTTDTEDEARSPRSPFLVKDLTLFDELTVDAVVCEDQNENRSPKKQRTPRKTKRRGFVMI